MATGLLIVVLILAAIAGYLLYFNFTPDTTLKLLTGLIGGLAGAIALIGVGLKSEKGHDSFMMFAPVNRATQLVDFGDLSKFKNDNIADLQRWSSPSVELAGAAFPVFPDPTPANTNSRIQDALQYMLLSRILILDSKDDTSWEFVRDEKGLRASAEVAPYPGDFAPVSSSLLSSQLSANPIFSKNPAIPKILWSGTNDQSVFRLPKGTSLNIATAPVSEGVSGQERLIVISKDNYFKLTITIRLAGRDFLPYPSGAEYKSGTITNLPYRITFDYEFYAISSNSTQATEYKAWIKWLVASLKSKAEMTLDFPADEPWMMAYPKAAIHKPNEEPSAGK